jgi:hypothetical protein
MKLSIHQPSYFPWLGLLQKIASSDVYMVMDEVQLSDSAYQNRNLLLSLDQKVKFITIPFNRKDYLKRSICELELRDQLWRKNHINFISNAYKEHAFYAEIFPKLDDFYKAEYATLIEAIMASMWLCLDFFDIKTELIFQRDMSYDRDLKKGELVANLVSAAGADVYLSGLGATAYMDNDLFEKGISVEYLNFSHPKYKQKNSTEFVSGLSCLDILFNLGIDDARLLINRR